MDKLTEKSLRPFWSGEMFNESVILVERDGQASARLMFPPEKALRVENAGLTERYTEGVDYAVRGRQIIALNGRLPRLSSDFIDRGVFPAEIEKFRGKYGLADFPFTEDAYFIKHNISVSYTYDKTAWEFIPEPPDPDCLPRFKKLLSAKKSVRVLFYGDSITNGAGSSKNYKIPPFLPPWTELFVLALEEKFGAKIEAANISESGMTSVWGADHIQEKQGTRDADLMVIAWGMNDATMKVPLDDYMQSVRRIMAYQKNDCEFILVGTMLANPLSPFRGDYRGFAQALKTFQNKHTAVADVGALHEYLLSRKDYLDMTQNNVNHPNDFLARGYAMTLLGFF